MSTDKFGGVFILLNIMYKVFTWSMNGLRGVLDILSRVQASAQGVMCLSFMSSTTDAMFTWKTGNTMLKNRTINILG